MSWSRPPSGFGQHVRSEVTKQRNALALQVFTGVVFRSPVLSGRFRGNNMVSVGSPSDEFDEGISDASGQATIARGQAVIAGAQNPFEIIYIMNNLPYAVPLEQGSSDQAPAGIYEVTINSISELS